jgi:phospholipase C
VLFDHVFQDLAGPSTPGDLAVFAAQSGQTQRALHPAEAGEPVLNGDDPLAGSPADAWKNLPVNPGDFPGYSAQLNQTYASLALSLAGADAGAIMREDADPADDLADIQDDIAYLSQSGEPDIAWGWYQEGFDREATDTATASHAGYVTDHDAPQYFGYIANNPAERVNIHGIGDFFTAVAQGQLPAVGGVFYLKGGYLNTLGLKPDNPLPAVQAGFLGDDDHPAYADSQISEAMVAKEVNAIAQSRYWPNAAIIITWADGGGQYDHMPPPARGADESFGPRVPLIVISPYAKVHQVAPQFGSQSSVVKFINTLFARDPLATLPDEARAKPAGPLDDDPALSALLPAFDVNRLAGSLAPLPAGFAEIPDSAITQLPQEGGQGCKALGIVPQDFLSGVPDDIPVDFNPLPKTNPAGVKG